MNVAKCARATEIMNKVKGRDPFAFSRRFIGYDESTEGILAQQREADIKLRQLQLLKSQQKVAKFTS